MRKVPKSSIKGERNPAATAVSCEVLIAKVQPSLLVGSKPIFQRDSITLCAETIIKNYNKASGAFRNEAVQAEGVEGFGLFFGFFFGIEGANQNPVNFVLVVRRCQSRGKTVGGELIENFFR